MRRGIHIVTVLGVLLAACGAASDGGGDTVTTSQPAVAGATTTTTPADSPTTTGGTAATSTTSGAEGPMAPDFTLALGNGGEFSLSGEQKPVYMVFWAEW